MPAPAPQALPYVVPRDNVRIECPISVVDKVRYNHCLNLNA